VIVVGEVVFAQVIYQSGVLIVKSALRSENVTRFADVYMIRIAVIIMLVLLTSVKIAPAYMMLNNVLMIRCAIVVGAAAYVLQIDQSGVQ